MLRRAWRTGTRVLRTGEFYRRPRLLPLLTHDEVVPGGACSMQGERHGVRGEESAAHIRDVRKAIPSATGGAESRTHLATSEHRPLREGVGRKVT